MSRRENVFTVDIEWPWRGSATELIECGFTITKTHELNSFEAAINLAGKGLGLAAIPDRNAKAAVERGVLRRIEIEGIAPEGFGKYSICVTYLKSDPEIRAREIFLEQLRSQIAAKENVRKEIISLLVEPDSKKIKSKNQIQLSFEFLQTNCLRSTMVHGNFVQ